MGKRLYYAALGLIYAGFIGAFAVGFTAGFTGTDLAQLQWALVFFGLLTTIGVLLLGPTLGKRWPYLAFMGAFTAGLGVAAGSQEAVVAGYAVETIGLLATAYYLWRVGDPYSKIAAILLAINAVGLFLF